MSCVAVTICTHLLFWMGEISTFFLQKQFLEQGVYECTWWCHSKVLSLKWTCWKTSAPCNIIVFTFFLYLVDWDLYKIEKLFLFESSSHEHEVWVWMWRDVVFFFSMIDISFFHFFNPCHLFKGVFHGYRDAIKNDHDYLGGCRKVSGQWSLQNA